MNKATRIIDEIKAAVGGQEFSSLEEAQAFLSGFTQSRNQAPLDDFDGLSPEQMVRFLHFPFDTPGLIQFAPSLTVEPTGSAITLFKIIADAIGESGLKPTANGNLPVKLVREAAITVVGEEGYYEYASTGWPRTEADYPDLHALRVAAEVAKLLRKYKGRFILSRAARTLLANQGLAGIYPRLLRSYATEFNWGYRDRYPEFAIIQQSFLFTLWVLDRYGDSWRPNTFYEDAFLKALPQVLIEAEEYRSNWAQPEERVRSCYSLRCLERFVCFFGLGETDRKPGEVRYGEFQIRKTPLLGRVVKFHANR